CERWKKSRTSHLDEGSSDPFETDWTRGWVSRRFRCQVPLPDRHERS
ncbi:MAG: hypothetical protein ACI9N0_003323, partial [Ilumatobacter sp.]